MQDRLDKLCSALEEAQLNKYKTFAPGSPGKYFPIITLDPHRPCLASSHISFDLPIHLRHVKIGPQMMTKREI